MVFEDPDGLVLHLYSWAGHGRDHSDRPGYGRPVSEDAAFPDPASPGAS
ncbi:hypothetical protein AB6O49_28860 [Streptomyces sp. SBR177]